MYRLRPSASLLRGVAQSATRTWAASSSSSLAGCTSEVVIPKVQWSLKGLWLSGERSLHTSLALNQEEAPPTPPVKFVEPERKYRSLADKELWHEAWMYEDRFGTETEPILVPSLEDERIIGVTDPEDENLVVWGILKAGEPPRQFIEGGEFYVLEVVPQVRKVGDVLLQLEGSKPGTPLPA